MDDEIAATPESVTQDDNAIAAFWPWPLQAVCHPGSVYPSLPVSPVHGAQ